MMKSTYGAPRRFAAWLLALAPLAAPAATVGQEVPPTVDVTAEQVRDFIDALPRDAISDRPIRIVDLGGHRAGVYGVFRPESSVQRAVLHNTTVAEIYYMLEGTGTLVTGGRLVEPTPSETSSLGTEFGPAIEGGSSREVGPGDIIFIPGGTPHWFSDMDGDITYLIFRPDPDEVQNLR